VTSGVAAVMATGTGLDPERDPRWGTAVRLARLGGRLALDRLADARVWFKDDDSMVTDVDVLIQGRLTAEIAAAFPDDAVAGEEGVHRAVPGMPEYLWALDPIDGTNNFACSLPGFAVSIGVLARGRPLIGAVYDPLADQLFTACAGHGAWRNTERLAVGSTSLGPRSLVCIRTPFVDGVPPAVIDWLTRYRIRRTGSTALQLCYVATGALAFVHDHAASLWDVAGAAPVVLEAGASLTTASGRPLFPVEAAVLHGETLTVLAGDPGAHQQALGALLARPTPAD
jgi:myo-inositol-1(or 4)-monophosphatase